MKPYKTITFLFLIVFFGGIVLNSGDRHSALPKEKISDTCDMCESVLPEADLFIKQTNPIPHYKAYNINTRTKRQELLGITIITTELAPDISGYSGPIKILIGIDMQGIIKGVKILQHSETQRYVTGFPSFIEQFVNRPATGSFIVGKNIDGISGATISSEAISTAITKSVNLASEKILNAAPFQPPGTKSKPIAYDQILIPVIIFAIAIMSILTGKNILRWISLLAGLVYFGFINHTMFSVVQISNISLLQLPKFAVSPMWYTLIILTVVSTLLFGRIYCGGICPFASVLEIIYKINPFKKLKPTRQIHILCIFIKYIVLIATVLLCITKGNANPAQVEVFVTFFTGNANLSGWIFLIFILIISSFNLRFWCKYLCPAGACLGIISRWSIYKIIPDKDCTFCKHCEDTCPTKAINLDKKPEINQAECIDCGECIRSCPDGQLKLKKQ